MLLPAYNFSRKDYPCKYRLSETARKDRFRKSPVDLEPHINPPSLPSRAEIVHATTLLENVCTELRIMRRFPT